MEEDDKKDEYNSESDFSNSTGFGIDSNNFDGFDKEEKQNNTIFEVKNDEIFNENEAAFEPKDDNVFNEENLHNLYFDADISKLDRVKKEYNKLSKDFESMIEHDKDKKLNISQAIESISDILPEHNKLFEKKDLLYDLFENINTSIYDAANKMKEMNGSFRITAGAYNGDNLSPKYYPNGRKGGSKARIKTYSAAEFGEKIGNITGKIRNVTIILDTYSNGRELFNAFQEDGYKVGENTITKGGEIGGKIGGGKFGAWAGAKIGAKWGAKIGSFIPVNPLVTKLFGFVAGGVIGGIVGGILGSLAGEKGGEFIVDMKNRKEEDKKE